MSLLRRRTPAGAPASTGGRFAVAPKAEPTTRLMSWLPGTLPPELESKPKWTDDWVTADDARALRNAG